MSGGYFDYKDCRIDSIIDQIEYDIEYSSYPDGNKFVHIPISGVSVEY